MAAQRSLLWIIFGLLALLVLGLLISPSKNSYSTTISDLSWPNCKYSPKTVSDLGIVGVTGGLDFKPNECLGGEIPLYAHYALYMNTGYPGAKYGRKYMKYPLSCSYNEYSCLAYNYGYNAAKYAMRYAYLQNAHTNFWWLDVETDNSWTTNAKINRQVIAGAAAAVQTNVLPSLVGIYSEPSQWNHLTNSWKHGWFEWIGTGALTQKKAQSYCTKASFTGSGPILLSQYTIKVDQDVDCSGLFSAIETVWPGQLLPFLYLHENLVGQASDAVML